MKNIVMLAFDCDPLKESESLVSWNMAFYMSKIANVTMITRPNAKRQIEEIILKNKISNLKFIYIDDDKLKNKFEKSKNIFKFYYLSKYIDSFFSKAGSIIKELERKNHIDVIHKVTPNSYRKIIDLSEYRECVKVFGPCGGAQETPKNLLNSLSFFQRIQENIHYLINWKTLHSKKYRKAINSYDYVLVTNSETKDKLDHILKEKKSIIMTDVAIASIIDDKQPDNDKDLFEILWVGRIMYRKGLKFLIDVLEKIDLPFIARIVGDGPDKMELEEIIKNKMLTDKIQLVGRVEHSLIDLYYDKADVFLFPSYRESSGNVLSEALSHGIPVIAFKQGGTPVILGNAGIYVDVENKKYDVLVYEYAKKIEFFMENKAELEKYKIKSLSQAQSLLWDEKMKEIMFYYDENKR